MLRKRKNFLMMFVGFEIQMSTKACACMYLESYRERSAPNRFLKVSEESERYPYAVVVDLDETVLDNSQYQVERWRDNLGFTQESWSKWVGEKRQS